MNKKLFWVNLILLSFLFVITKKFGFTILQSNSEVKGTLWPFLILICIIYIYKIFKPSLNTIYSLFNIISVIIFIILIGFFIYGAEEFVIIKGYFSIVKLASYEEKTELLCNLMLQESKLRPNFIEKFLEMDDITALKFKDIINNSRTLRELESNFDDFVYCNFGPRPNPFIRDIIIGLLGVFLGIMWFIVIYIVF